MPGSFLDYAAPIITHSEDGQRVMRDARWGMPSPKPALFRAATARADQLWAKGTEFAFAELMKIEHDKGTTNVRNTTSEKTGSTNVYWAPWLGAGNRCLVPFTSFAEPSEGHETTRQNMWFGLECPPAGLYCAPGAIGTSRRGP